MFNETALSQLRSSSSVLKKDVTTLHCAIEDRTSEDDITNHLASMYKSFGISFSAVAAEAAQKLGTTEITLRKVFNELFSDLRIDSKYARSINSYQVGFINRNQDHLEFFGGNLLGVQVIRFKDSDVNKFFDEILDIEYSFVEKEIRTVTTIDHTYKIAGDILNLTLSYLLHRCVTSEYMDDKKRHRAALDTALIFFYRCICAVHSYYFKYPFDHKVAQEAYARLSGKYLIKQLGSWQEVMIYRAERLLEKGSPHIQELFRYDNDDAAVYMIEDSQSRVKDLVKNYAIELYKVHEEGANIATTSSTMIDVDGNETTRDKVGTTETKVQTMRSLINDKNAFVRDNYISIIAKTNSNTSARIIRNTLNWMVDNYTVTKYSADIDTFLSKVIVQTMYMIETNIPINKRRDIPFILKTLKDLYLSTRTTDQDVVEIRELGNKIVKYANGRVSNSLALSTRTSVILYITLRLLATM